MGLRLHALDLQRDAAELGVDADVELEQVEDLGLEGHPRAEVLHLQADLVDLDHGDVEVDVGVFVLAPAGGRGHRLPLGAGFHQLSVVSAFVPLLVPVGHRRIPSLLRGGQARSTLASSLSRGDLDGEGDFDSTKPRQRAPSFDWQHLTWPRHAIMRLTCARRLLNGKAMSGERDPATRGYGRSRMAEWIRRWTRSCDAREAG